MCWQIMEHLPELRSPKPKYTGTKSQSRKSLSEEQTVTDVQNVVIVSLLGRGRSGLEGMAQSNVPFHSQLKSGQL